MTNVATIDLLNALSPDRGVIVRRNAHGSDNRAPLHGIATAPGPVACGWDRRLCRLSGAVDTDAGK